MSRTELIVIVTTALILAIVLGWCLRWVFGLMNRPPAAGPIPESEMEARLREAEAARDAALAERQTLEADLSSQLREARAEAEAAMDALRSARQEAEALRAGQG